MEIGRLKLDSISFFVGDLRGFTIRRIVNKFRRIINRYSLVCYIVLIIAIILI